MYSIHVESNTVVVRALADRSELVMELNDAQRLNLHLVVALYRNHASSGILSPVKFANVELSVEQAEQLIDDVGVAIEALARRGNLPQPKVESEKVNWLKEGF